MQPHRLSYERKRVYAILRQIGYTKWHILAAENLATEARLMVKQTVIQGDENGVWLHHAS